MNWRDAFLAQARSDAEIRILLNRKRCEYSHQLHYLQMVTEKLAKGLMASQNNAPPVKTHAAFVRCLQHIKGRPDLRRQLGYKERSVFRSFIDSLLPLASEIERLAPKFSGTTQPNPEYPWQPTPEHEVEVPANFSFSAFDSCSPRMIKLVLLIENLLRITS